MKKENLELINSTINNIIKEEVGKEYEENKNMRANIIKLESDNKKLQNEIYKLKQSNEENNKLLQSAFELCKELINDNIIKEVSDGDGGYDEYGNGGGWEMHAFVYKEKQYLEVGSSW